MGGKKAVVLKRGREKGIRTEETIGDYVDAGQPCGKQDQEQSKKGEGLKMRS